ncbi:MAG: glycosyltransferase family 2 protein [Oligoflexia bacterium]|nr:glycosyltransferase family 2 protein [Oligoflexia bacterium]
MLNNKTVAVVVSAFNEETQIEMVLNTMPSFVDKIVVVNDCSTDRTLDVLKKYIENNLYSSPSSTPTPTTNSTLSNFSNSQYREADRIVLEMYKKEVQALVPFEIISNIKNQKIVILNNKINGGKGMCVAVGYSWCRDLDFDCVATMDGDGQMDPSELYSLCWPIVSSNDNNGSNGNNDNERVDFVKGNRLMHKSAFYVMPKIRFIGNSILTILTKIASGYWHVSDTQTGYATISKRALKYIRLDKLYARYGVHNDILVKLNIANCVIKEIEIRPVYRIGEKSKMKIAKVIPRISWLLIRSFFYRLWFKHFFRDFHPLFLLYNLSFLLFLIILPLSLSILHDVFIQNIHVQTGSYIVFVILSLGCFQSLLFAMWMDIQNNERLYK